MSDRDDENARRVWDEHCRSDWTRGDTLTGVIAAALREARADERATLRARLEAVPVPRPVHFAGFNPVEPSIDWNAGAGAMQRALLAAIDKPSRLPPLCDECDWTYGCFNGSEPCRKKVTP